MKKSETIVRFTKTHRDSIGYPAASDITPDEPWDFLHIGGDDIPADAPKWNAEPDTISDVRSAVDNILASTGFKPTKVIYTEEQRKILLEHGERQGRVIAFSERTKLDLEKKLGVTALLDKISSGSGVVGLHKKNLEGLTGLLLIDDHLKPDDYDPIEHDRRCTKFQQMLARRIAKNAMGLYTIRLDSQFRTPRQQEILENAAGKTHRHFHRKPDV